MSDDFHDARLFRPRQIADWMDLILKTVAVISISGVMFVGGVRAFLPDWYNGPAKLEEVTGQLGEVSTDLETLSKEVGALRQDLQDRKPVLLDFKGSLIVAESTVKPGQTLPIVMVVRRNVSCETVIRVRFFDHRTNTIASRYSYEMPAQKAPVSESFQPFAIQLFIPFELPPGRYSYFPEIIPSACGVYGPMVPPMSAPFDVAA